MKREASAPENQSAAPQKASLEQVILAFASPLLALDAKAAADPDVLSQLMVLVDMCWNLPVLEASDPAAHARLKQGFDSVVKDVPAPIAEQLRKLLVERTARFAALSFLVHTRVHTDAATGKAGIVVEARKPR
jgi:hypothetical protein